MLAQPAQDSCQQDVRRRVGRVQLHRRLQGVPRLGQVFGRRRLLGRAAAETMPHEQPDVVPPEFPLDDGVIGEPLGRPLGRFHRPGLVAGHGQVSRRRPGAGVGLQRRRQVLDRLALAVQVVQRHAVPVPHRLGRFGLPGRRFQRRGQGSPVPGANRLVRPGRQGRRLLGFRHLPPQRRRKTRTQHRKPHSHTHLLFAESSGPRAGPASEDMTSAHPGPGRGVVTGELGDGALNS